MKTINAHVFQNNYTGIQIFVYHANISSEAISQICESAININDYTYLGIKQVLE